MEKGAFIPSREKLKNIAKALGIPFKELDVLLMKSKLKQLGVKGAELMSFFKDVPSLPEKNKRAIINAHLSIKERRQKRKS